MCSFALLEPEELRNSCCESRTLCSSKSCENHDFFFLTILPERVFCEGSRANLRSILDPTLWASFPGVYPLPPRLRAAASLRDCGSRSRAAVQPRGHGP